MMTAMRIFLAISDEAARRFYGDALADLGHYALAAASGEAMLAACPNDPPDVVIVDVAALEAAKSLQRQQPVPVILTSDFSDPAIVELARRYSLYGYLDQRVTSSECLASMLAIVKLRFDEAQELKREAQMLHTQIEERKLIERAKGLLMLQNSMDEETAYRRLQSIARSQSVKMIDVAKVMLATR